MCSCNTNRITFMAYYIILIWQTVLRLFYDVFLKILAFSLIIAHKTMKICDFSLA